ncbi:hypothetical protein F8G81_21700 [Arthrobacter sp. CDRTa11]|uniref:hypothetical protein n=1 Tax=Arthrobacter sp. CDRTa11 TaxID=2651199 RepID=UPI002265BA1A|nr:hypothetical protein [Arthrobacter sp. CDRTa11]UZX04916.1 hypothetical protein F8G81_21700 [Arthrobacter sp. CDRTa11]
MTENNDLDNAGISDENTPAGVEEGEGEYLEGDYRRAGAGDPDARVGEGEYAQGDYGRAGTAGADERPDISEADAAGEDRTLRGDSEGS